MKPDEARLILEVAEIHEKAGGGRVAILVPFVDEIADGLGIHAKRAAYLAEKWIKKGWWDCGVSTRSGWFTDAGRAKVAELRGET